MQDLVLWKDWGPVYSVRYEVKDLQKAKDLMRSYDENTESVLWPNTEQPEVFS